MTGVTWTLAVLSVVTLYLGLPLPGGAPMERFLSPVFVLATRTQSALVMPHEEGVPWGDYFIALVLAWAGAGVAIALFRDPALKQRLAERLRGLIAVTQEKFYVDEIYQALFVKPLWFIARGLWYLVDVWIIDNFAVKGSALFMAFTSRYILRPLQTGNAQGYATLMAISSVVLLYLLLR
jgi:NADH-quinone oxidoreductase subunit L